MPAKISHAMKLIAFFLFLQQSFAQGDSVLVASAVNRLSLALTGNDTVELKSLLHPAVQYGHSNGWVQNRNEIVADMRSGKLKYKTITQKDIRISAQKKSAVVREVVFVEGTVNEKPFTMELSVLQVWIKSKKRWLLYARQSTKTG
jgi:hypothetical protein